MRISDWSSDVCSSDLVTGSNYAPGSGLAPQAPQGERVLVYGDLKSVKPYAEYRAPDREIVLKLTGNMERYFWSINGKKYSEAKPIRLNYGERDRKRVVEGKSMSVRVDVGGRRIIKNKKLRQSKQTFDSTDRTS